MFYSNKLIFAYLYDKIEFCLQNLILLLQNWSDHKTNLYDRNDFIMTEFNFVYRKLILITKRSSHSAPRTAGTPVFQSVWILTKQLTLSLFKSQVRHNDKDFKFENGPFSNTIKTHIKNKCWKIKSKNCLKLKITRLKWEHR